MGGHSFCGLKYSSLLHGHHDTWKQKLWILPTTSNNCNRNYRFGAQYCCQAPHLEFSKPSVKAQMSTFENLTEEVNPVEVVWPSPDDEIPFWKQDFSSKLRNFNRAYAKVSQQPVGQDSEKLHVVHVTAEMAPLAKVGGLADVVTGLARACLNMGHKVEVMLPFYECLPRDQITELTTAEEFSSFHTGDWSVVKLYRGKVSGIPVLLIEPSNHFFKGSRIYGGSYNELEAYLFFSRACLEWMQVTGTQPDILHVHEWQTSGLPLLYWDMYHHLSLKKPRIVLTIHNMEHYGECRVEQLSMCGLDGPAYGTIEKAIDDRTIGHNPERLSLLKGGIVYSNAVTFSGILNGIDTILWDPSRDPYLPARYDALQVEGKQICKQYVQRGLGMEVSDPQLGLNSHSKPIVVCITRLVAQKGIHLIRFAIDRLNQLGGQFILLGTAPDWRIQGEFENLVHQHKRGNSVRLLLTYSEELAHMLYAAADFVLVPSMFEPCGLTQMIGMRYGAIPVVRKTGGLADTVYDMDDPSNTHKANGFLFEGIDEGSLNGALERAFKYYLENPNGWTSLISRVMSLDNSWERSARDYVSLYKSVQVRW
ncbi:hypothetical protein GOP47_0017536 [Adiantum capillus-veneris]|uniref:starch synthase n=1 Tax=Adiantum capillus-veneris TaxID=13818 RepID=A0A9D4UGF1_ADICA|nr:hypothetical protein GOP47_0017536 [Adiantum capillus-veneris]